MVSLTVLRRVRFAVEAAIITLLGCGSASAHQQEVGSILISEHYVEPAKAGDDTIARLRLENLGGSTRQVMGLHSDVAEDSIIEVKIASGRATQIGSLPIRAGETLDLEDAAWIRLTGLNRDLVHGETIEVHLDLAGGREKPIALTVGDIEH